MRALSSTECWTGFNAAFENAERFYKDALCLKRRRHLLSAALLAIYAFDELGKASLIARAALRVDRSDLTWQKFHKEFRRHEPKIREAQGLLSLFQVGWLLGDPRSQEIVTDLSQRVLKLRAAVAYVELHNNKFSRPSKALNKDCKKVIEKVGLTLDIFLRNRARIRAMFNETPAS